MATIVYNKGNTELSTPTDSSTFELSNRDATDLFTFKNGLNGVGVGSEWSAIGYFAGASTGLFA